MMSTEIHLRENYANTLFELAGEKQVIDIVKEDLETIDGIIKEEADLVKFLMSPYFSRQSKEQLMATVFAARISELTMNFLLVLIKHNRLGLLPEIILRYRELWDEKHRYYPVKVTVSHPLEPSEAEKLRADIEAAIGGTARLEWVVNPDILGGTIIRCGDKVIDNSVYSRLQAAVKTIISQVKGRN